MITRKIEYFSIHTPSMGEDDRNLPELHEIYIHVPDDERTPVRAPSSCYTTLAKNTAIGAVSLASIVSDCMQIQDGLSDSESKILGFIDPHSNATQWAIPGLDFMTYPFLFHRVKEGWEEIYQMSQGRYAANWTPLNGTKYYLANFTSFILNGWALFADCMATKYFLNMDGWNNKFSNGMAALAAMSNLSIKSLPVHKFIRSKFASKNEMQSLPPEAKPEPAEKTFREMLADFSFESLKKMLMLFGASQNLLTSYAPIAAIFDFVPTPVKWVFLMMSITNTMTNLAYDGKITSEAIDVFRAKLAEGFTAKEWGLFCVGLFASSFISNTTFNNTIAFFENPDAEFPKPIPPILPEGFKFAYACMTGIQDGVNFMFILNYLLNLVKKHMPEERKVVTDKPFTTSSPLLQHSFLASKYQTNSQAGNSPAAVTEEKNPQVTITIQP